ncbi:hypothetical protein LTR56_017496 [Elasticomyces elasticus]|nr:hypothetical protein LTR56_017496 [Elasticomyces elasticus]KAK3640905.1 hypothetical protein LTR22_016830 [Elasticomyces elasticus]KAK4920292.1 hypothetical protein LTR49_012071 [Elasticomyces elasticus]KAK5759095.1 hypothetical protein LTS12_010870 [Elasticomyces elasticus]
MRDVGIVASTDDKLKESTNLGLQVMVIMPVWDDGAALGDQCYDRLANLHSALSEYAPSFTKHAICLREGPSHLDGIILVAVTPNVEDQKTPSQYTKLGDFFLDTREDAGEIQTFNVGGWEVF